MQFRLIARPFATAYMAARPKVRAASLRRPRKVVAAVAGAAVKVLPAIYGAIRPPSSGSSRKPRLLFRAPAVPHDASGHQLSRRQYRVTADGQRFLLCLPVTSVQREPLRVLLNWPARLAHTE